MVPTNWNLSVAEVYKCLYKYSTSWYTFGVCLGVPTHRLKAIEQDYNNTDRRLLAMVEEWINTGEATGGDLLDAFKQIISSGGQQHTSELHEFQEIFGRSRGQSVCSQKAKYNDQYLKMKESSHQRLARIKTLLNVPEGTNDAMVLCHLDQYLSFVSMADHAPHIAEIMKEVAVGFQCSQQHLCDLVTVMRLEAIAIEEDSLRTDDPEKVEEYKLMLSDHLDACKVCVYTELTQNENWLCASSKAQMTVKCIALTTSLLCVPFCLMLVLILNELFPQNVSVHKYLMMVVACSTSHSGVVAYGPLCYAYAR